MTTNITEQNQYPGTKWLAGPTTKEAKFTAAVTGTSATITDTTTYAVADQDGLTSIITIVGDPDNVDAQTVTFSGATTTALQVAAQINDQCKGLSAVVTGGQVVLTTDKVGAGVSISVGAGTGALTWDTPVAGTGVGASDALEITVGMLLGRTTSGTAPYTAGDLVPYNSANSPAGSNVIVGVASADRSLAATGSISIDYAIAGKLKEDEISKADGSAVTVAELDALRANTGILPITVTDQSVYL
jgi:hypothetical protein